MTESARLKSEGFEPRHEDGVTCCYAVQDKFWVKAADNREWEIYTVLADAPAAVQTPAPQPSASAPSCCGPTTVAYVTGGRAPAARPS